MQINFVKTHPDAVIPTRGSAGAAGFDLTAVSLRRAADLYIYDIGIAMEMPGRILCRHLPALQYLLHRPGADQLRGRHRQRLPRPHFRDLP